MAIERTFGIVKPDAVAKGAVGGVIDMIEKGGLKVIALRMTLMSKPEAEGFYAVHKARPFFGGLIDGYSTKVKGLKPSKGTLNLESFGHGFRTIWFG